VQSEEWRVAGDAGFEATGDLPDAGVVVLVGTGRDEGADYGPVVVWRREPGHCWVVAADAEGDDVGRFEQGEFVTDFDPNPAELVALAIPQN
jgi:hypothetical protein